MNIAALAIPGSYWGKTAGLKPCCSPSVPHGSLGVLCLFVNTADFLDSALRLPAEEWIQDPFYRCSGSRTASKREQVVGRNQCSVALAGVRVLVWRWFLASAQLHPAVTKFLRSCLVSL